MSFGSLAEFLDMGGHGLYVWLCYGTALIIVAYNVVSVRRAMRRFEADAVARRRRRAGAAPADQRLTAGTK